MYTSAKNDINTQLLRKYIAHRVFGVAFSKPAHIVDDMSVFIPSGWDSEKKLELEHEAIANPDTPVTIGEEVAASTNANELIECKNEQKFMEELLDALAKAPSSPKREPQQTSLAPAKETVATAASNSPLASYFGSLIKKEPAVAKQ